MKTIMMTRAEAAKYNLEHVYKNYDESFFRMLIRMDENDFLELCTLPVIPLGNNKYYITISA